MKKFLSLALCLAVLLSCVMIFAACNGSGETNETEAGTVAKTEAPTETPTETPTEEATEAPTEAPTEEATQADEDGTTDASGDNGGYDPEYYVVINTAEDLMNFNKKVNEVDEDGFPINDFYEMTVVLTADIDLTGYDWEPLNGYALDETTFDGNGYTISNMYISYNEENETLTEDEIGAGFIGVAHYNVYFKDISFDNCKIDAYERHVGCLVGKSWNGAAVDFTNVKVTNFEVNGWMDNNVEASEGRKIAFRVAGIMGAAWGPATFYQCTVENAKLSGFHNLAGILGYDGSRTIDEYSFEECVVNNVEMTFSYCQAEAYTIDMPRKFVSVFYNAANWGDNIDYCVEMGNTYSSISFYDWTDDNAEYTPAEFRSWDREEADASGL